jgi:hypothetical protein
MQQYFIKRRNTMVKSINSVVEPEWSQVEVLVEPEWSQVEVLLSELSKKESRFLSCLWQIIEEQ